MIRVQVDDKCGAAVVIVDPPESLRPRQRDQLAAIAGELIADLARILDTDDDHVLKIAVAELARPGGRR